jgi:hypothetical protein
MARPSREEHLMPLPPPVTLPADADLYMFSYAKLSTPLAARMTEVALRASARYGAAPAALVVPLAEFDAYLAAQEGEEAIYPLLPSPRLAVDHIGTLAPRRREGPQESA